jgi:drug/metabolite transporter (DMT)-like permease
VLIGVLAALLACFGYGTASVLQAYGARKEAAAVAEAGAPSLRTTIAAALTPAFLCGLVLDGLGFVGSVVSARLIPLFLAQTIMSANLVVTAVLGVLVLRVRLHARDWTAIAVVVVSLCLLAASAGHTGEGPSSPALHWGVLIASVVFLAVGLGMVQLLRARAAIPAGLVAGLLFGAMAIAVRIVAGLDPFRLGVVLADPAAWTVLIAGVGGFYLFTVAPQLGSVNGAAAALVAGETVVPGIAGIVLLGDTTAPGLGWLMVVAFIGAVVGAVAVAIFGAAQHDAPVTPG